MSDERRLEVLRAIVQDYVATSEPVGSKALLERHQLGVSAATIRNDMAALEDAGLISAPHTSAGRVPTDAGYRIFVDRLSQVRPLSATQRRAIETFLRQSVDLDDIVERTARLLATLTNQAAVMQYPSLRRSRVRHIELVPAAEGRLSLVVILDSGRIEQRFVSVASADDERLVQTLRARVNEVSGARLLTEAAAAMTELGAEFEPGQRADVDTIVATIAAVLAEDREERVVLAGTANLARAGLRDDAGLSVSRVLEALEEHVVLMRLISTRDDDPTHEVTVRIGAENDFAGLESTSLVTTAYGSDAVATLGVLGPTRMDYPQTMANVRAVARYVSELLEQ